MDGTEIDIDIVMKIGDCGNEDWRIETQGLALKSVEEICVKIGIAVGIEIEIEDVRIEGLNLKDCWVLILRRWRWRLKDLD